MNGKIDELLGMMDEVVVEHKGKGGGRTNWKKDELEEFLVALRDRATKNGKKKVYVPVYIMSEFYDGDVNRDRIATRMKNSLERLEDGRFLTRLGIKKVGGEDKAKYRLPDGRTGKGVVRFEF